MYNTFKYHALKIGKRLHCLSLLLSPKLGLTKPITVHGKISETEYSIVPSWSKITLQNTYLRRSIIAYSDLYS
jgi:hypothetical protein